jgi:hypothetical protein
MSYFAKIENSIVVDVIVAEQDFIDSGAVGDPVQWVQTSYNTRGGIHYNPETGEPSEDQSKALRKNYAALGYTYDKIKDAFIAPKPFDGWILNPETCLWNPPTPIPDDPVDENGVVLGFYEWDNNQYNVSGNGWILQPPPTIK